MPCINADTAAAWQAMADDADAQRPSPGRHVRIVGGRKHRGRVGTVIRYERSQYDRIDRYRSEASHHMCDIVGRAGWRVQVRDESNGELFWCDANYTEVLP